MTPERFASTRFRSTSRSPGTNTQIGFSSAIRSTFFKVLAAVIFAPYLLFKTSTKESIVGVFGVSKISIAPAALPAKGLTDVTIASTFAA